MKSRAGLESSLGRIVDAIAGLREVLAIILFGSRARGDYDEYSDYDVLVVFRDEKSMWKSWDSLYERVGKLGLFTQVITKSVRELAEKTSPTFLNSVLSEGRLLYLRYPMEAPAYLTGMRRLKLITYTLSGLIQSDKMKVIYRLYGRKDGRGYRGLIEELGGLKLGEGCLLLEEEKAERVLDALKQHKVQYDVLKVYLSAEGRTVFSSPIS